MFGPVIIVRLQLEDAYCRKRGDGEEGEDGGRR